MSELTVILKDSERTYRQKFLMYNPYTMTYDDPQILQCINDAKQNFQGEPEDIRIRASMEIQ
jgi:hypothetical protein